MIVVSCSLSFYCTIFDLMQDFETALTDVERHVSALTRIKSLKESSDKLYRDSICSFENRSPMESAQVYAALAYTLDSLYFGTILIVLS